jgi:hypothetical protein
MYARSYSLAEKVGSIMVQGLILIGTVAFLVTRNRWIALRLGVEPKLFQLPFFSSVARQNIAVIGAFMFATGIAFIFVL